MVAYWYCSDETVHYKFDERHETVIFLRF